MSTDILAKGRAVFEGDQWIIQHAVIGEDERHPVTDLNEPPWIRIVRLEALTDYMTPVIGTGFFVHPQIIMTAAHCMRGNRFPGGHVNAVRISGSVLANATITVDDQDNLRTPWSWLDGDGFQHFDFGFIDLRGTQFHASEVFELSNDITDLNGLHANIAGFPADLTDGAMYHHTAAITFVGGTELHYVVDTTPGQSGAPVWCYSNTDSNDALLAGLHVRAGETAADHSDTATQPTHNEGIPISYDLLQFFGEVVGA